MGWDTNSCWTLQRIGPATVVELMCLSSVLPVLNDLLRLGLITLSGLEGIFSIKETWPKPYSFPPLLHACCQQVWLLCQCVCKRQYWITVQTWFVTPAHRLCWGGAQHLFYGYRLNLTTCIVFPALLQCMSNSFTEAHRRNPTVSPSQHLS